MMTCTTDEYVANLYNCLWECLVIAQDCVEKEAQRQKWLYDHKVGAIELRPGDRMLVRLDAFRGQWRKLKNWWGGDFHMVVTRVVDGIPPYVVKNDCTGERKVLHWARLLLWLSDYGEPVRCNLINLSNETPGPAPDQCPPKGSENGDSVLGCSLQYSLELTAYLAVIDDLEHMLSKLGCEVHTGAP